jgi:hypothetical protein
MSAIRAEGLVFRMVVNVFNDCLKVNSASDARSTLAKCVPNFLRTNVAHVKAEQRERKKGPTYWDWRRYLSGLVCGKHQASTL